LKTATDDKVNIRLVTPGHGTISSAVDTRGVQGQWESYRVVTEGRNVWLQKAAESVITMEPFAQ
jgi:hypothetical protein